MKISEIIAALMLGYVGVALILTLIGVFVETFAFAGYMLAMALPIVLFGSLIYILADAYEESKGL